MSSIRDHLESVLPPILFRNNHKFKEWTGFSPRTLANADAAGEGPDERVYSGRACGYPREALLRWLEARSVVLPKKDSNTKKEGDRKR